MLALLLSLTLAQLPVLAANLPTPKPLSNEAARTLTLRLLGEPETLDWNKAHTPIETDVLLNVMEGLVTYESGLKLAPSLAQSWSISQDGKTYTFKLRPGVRWSDGVPLKAKDFVYSWRRLLSPVTAASYAYFLFDVEGAEAFNKGQVADFAQVGVKAIDDLTLQVKLTRPVAHWIHIPTFWVTFPLREDVIDKYGASWDSPGRMVTLGPFQMVSHDYDSKIVLKANPTYWGPRGNIETVICQIIKDDSTALSLYEAGKIDFLTDLSTLDLKRLRGNSELHAYPHLKTVYLGLVTTKFPMTNPKIRHAIAMAIDKSKLGDILHGGQQGATSWVPPGLLAHSNKGGLPFDPARAKAELKGAGLDPSRPVTIEILMQNSEKTIMLAQYIQSELKRNLGLQVTLQPFDNKTYRAQADLKSFPMLIASWGADYPDPDNFMSVFLSSAGNNRTGWKSPRYDEQVMAGRGTMDPKGREKLYAEAQKALLVDDTAIVPLYYDPSLALTRKRVHGIELNPLSYLYLRKASLN